MRSIANMAAVLALGVMFVVTREAAWSGGERARLAAEVVRASTQSVLPEHEGRLVYVAGSALPESPASDPAFAIEAHALRVEREVSTLQGGTWQPFGLMTDRDRADPSRARSPLFLDSFVSVAPRARMGARRLGEDVLWKLECRQDFQLGEASVRALPGWLRPHARLENGTIRFSGYDVRVRARILPAGPVTVMGIQRGGGFAEADAVAGVLSLGEMIERRSPTRIHVGAVLVAALICTLLMWSVAGSGAPAIVLLSLALASWRQQPAWTCAALAAAAVAQVVRRRTERPVPSPQASPSPPPAPEEPPALVRMRALAQRTGAGLCVERPWYNGWIYVENVRGGRLSITYGVDPRDGYPCTQLEFARAGIGRGGADATSLRIWPQVSILDDRLVVNLQDPGQPGDPEPLRARMLELVEHLIARPYEPPALKLARALAGQTGARVHASDTPERDGWSYTESLLDGQLSIAWRRDASAATPSTSVRFERPGIGRGQHQGSREIWPGAEVYQDALECTVYEWSDPGPLRERMLALARHLIELPARPTEVAVQHSDAVCQVCGSTIGSEPATCCPSCETAHHTSCWEYAGGCSIYGCERRARA